ncbi:hypothetical protein CWI36_0806p0010 [Hamiltosporidium magnivora]|uniref:Uncharacterized protein n=1 Tax=Hamiltosporidium magnivora TaxID=148818 RepID=A0A4Q9L9M7_9MICR|nr:hypothetical protein CWI36_0806p0010 [Hamiltosporidium magnivora]
MIIEKFYTIMYFLEYFRVKHDNKLRNVIKIIWYSLVKSEEINNFDIEKVSFHFSKQDYFSHKMFKKISQEYFKVIKFEMNTFDLFFSKKEINYISNKGKGLYTREGKHVLTIINSEFDLFISEKVDVHSKSKSLFLIFLNTLDIRYLPFCDICIISSKAFCIILESLKKRIDEIVFVQCYISDRTIISLNNINLNFVNLEKIVFIECVIESSLVFNENLSKIDQLMFFVIKNLDIVDNIVEILKRTYHKSTPEEVISQKSNNIDKNKDFYLRLLNDEKSKAKFKIFESIVYVSSSLSHRYFYQYNGCYNKISITLSRLNSKEMFKSKDTIIDKNTKCIKIASSALTSIFLNDILSVIGLETLGINYSDILFENDICVKNKPINYFDFWLKTRQASGYFIELINMMIGLEEASLTWINSLKLSRSLIQCFYITELGVSEVSKMIYSFDFKSANNDISDFNCHSDSLKLLFENYDLSSIKKGTLSQFSIDKLNLKAFSNLHNLKELNFLRINFENISLSELFSDEDLIFIASLQNLKELEFEGCYIKQKTYLHCIKMLFINGFYIELICSHLSEEIIQFIKEAFKVKNSDINVIQGFGISKNIYL